MKYLCSLTQGWEGLSSKTAHLEQSSNMTTCLENVTYSEIVKELGPASLKRRKYCRWDLKTQPKVLVYLKMPHSYQEEKGSLVPLSMVE